MTKEQYDLLKTLSKGPVFHKDIDDNTKAVGRFLNKCGFSDFVYDTSDVPFPIGWKINESGKAELSKIRKSASDSRRSEIRSWITTIIAVLAFILSVLSLSWQVYSWQSKESQTPTGATTAVCGPSYTR